MSYASTVKNKRAFTLIEMLVVVAVIVILLSIVAGVGRNVYTKAQIRNTEATITTLSTILQEYQNQNKNRDFPTPTTVAPAPVNDLSDFDLLRKRFGYFYHGNENYIAVVDCKAGDHDVFTWDDESDFTDDIKPVADHRADRLYARASIEFMYQFLDEVTACREKLAKLPESVVVNSDKDSIYLFDRTKPLLEIVDAWDHPLMYEATSGNFPTITSAGPDGMFDTADDIISSEF